MNSQYTTDNNSTTGRKSVSFGVVRIREHERILVDETDSRCNNEYALGLGWQYNQSSQRCLVDDLEREKEQQEQQTSFGYYNHPPTELRPYTALERMHVLNEYGYSMSEVMEHERNMQKQRRKNRRGSILKFFLLRR